MIGTRKLTRSGIKLTEIGLGCATLGFDSSAAARAEARRMLSDAISTDIRYFDTAPLYGSGLSERIVGDALRGRADIVLSSKVGRLLHADADASTYMPFSVAFDYTYDGIMRSFDHSLQRLGLDKVDILYAHDLGRHTHGSDAPAQSDAFFNGGGYRALEALRQSGVVRAIGLGVNEVEICFRALDQGEFDLFLLAGRYTLLERNAALGLFDACAKCGTDVVIGGPFNSGLLVGGDTYNYRAIPDEVSSIYNSLLEYCSAHGMEVAAAALQFPLRHPVVKSVIPGPKSSSELSQILNWAELDIPKSFWAGLEELGGL